LGHLSFFVGRSGSTAGMSVMSTHVFHYFNHALVFDTQYDTDRP